MTQARDKANIPVLNFASKGIDDNADATAITIDSSENVGIKNTTMASFSNLPATDLVVGSGSTHSGITIYSSASSGSNIAFADGASGDARNQGIIQYHHNGDYMRFFTSASERMRITSTGLGIGTSSPRAKLDLGSGSGDSSTISTTPSDYQLILEAPQGTGDYGRNIGWSVGTNGVFASINAVDTGSSDKTGLAFITGDNSGVAEAVRISHDGKIGIGTSNPGATLDVNGTIGVESGNSYRFGNNANTRIEGSNATNVRLGFFTGGSERMRINSDGDTLIGCTAMPSTSVNGVGFDVSNSSEIKSSIAGTGNATRVRFFNGNGEVGTIRTNGSATAYNTSSDYRLKENVNYDFDATTRLKQLKPARFNFIKDADTTVDGFIAHEVSSIVPEAISGTKDAVDEDGTPELSRYRPI